MRKIVEEKVTPPTAINRDYPPPLELIVMRALEKRPEDRYQSAEEMSHDLEEFLEESGLRSGNRRMSLYMQELFAPDAATSDAGVAASRSFAEPRRRRGRRALGRAGPGSARAAGDAYRGRPRGGRARHAWHLGRIGRDVDAAGDAGAVANRRCSAGRRKSGGDRGEQDS